VRNQTIEKEKKLDAAVLFHPKSLKSNDFAAPIQQLPFTEFGPGIVSNRLNCTFVNPKLAFSG